MHFKRLELFGFKSFAERAVFHFEPGVTAIVGPNGCGKTNCVDAIRWVLGEQRARDLRGHTMEDVIFNGTEAVPPLGFAEVHLTLSNEDHTLPIDYNEVTITRRVYRSGESEYLLNKAQVRLRDIHELLAGTGIGVESYSIIGQGQINQILSARPEERRQVFEEASGITAYKTKKREALRKLEQTDQNLLRVNDIVLEVERQLRAIERQVGKARRYQERFAQLQALDLQIASIEQARIAAERAHLQAQREALDAQARETAAMWEMLRRQEDELSAQRETQLQQLTTRQTARAKTQGELDSHQRELQLKTHWCQDVERRQTVLRAESDTLRQRETQLYAQRESAARALATVQQEAAQHAERVRASEAQLAEHERQVHEARATQERIKQQLVDQHAAAARAKNDQAKLTAMAQAHQARIRRLRLDQAERTAQTTSLETKQREHESQQQSLEAQRADHAQQAEAARTQRQALERRAHEGTRACDTLRQQQAECAATCHMLEQLWQRHEGFSSGVKALREAQHPAVLGIVADLVDVRSGWEAAMEAALGTLAQAVVVETTADAWRVLHWLRERGAGRVHCIPLDQQPPANGAPNTMPPELSQNVIGSADSVVTIREPRIAPVVQQQLAALWCVDQLAHVSPWPTNGTRLLDQAGNLWQHGMLMGGSRETHVSVVGRRARLEAAQQQLTHIQEQLSGQEHALGAAQSALAQAAADVEHAGSALQAVEQQCAMHGVTTQQVREELERVHQECALVDSELAEAETECHAVEAQQHTAAATITEAEVMVGQLEADLGTQQAALESQAQVRERALVELARLRTNRETVTARCQTCEEAVADIVTRVTDTEQILRARQTQIAEAQQRAAQCTQEIAAHESSATELTAAVSAMEAELTALTREVESLKQRMEALDPDVLRAQRALEALRDQQRETDLALAEQQYKSQAVAERIRDRYKCDVPAAPETLPDHAAFTQMHSEAATLREKVESLGSVSLDSIADQEELSKRHEFLTTQQQDLATAQASLKEAIAKMNRETRKLFMETFLQIQHEFRYFFKLLFGGGKAELALMDEQQVLDCGIDIQAQPPGKKLQSISLLSGGEQAMTAVALLFALFKVHPSPFCVLDEIDAPLDESNVDRFTRALSEFAQLSQFIIITHNKKTITRADLMYGITMERAGISKIVSVRFAENDTLAPAAPVAEPVEATVA